MVLELTRLAVTRIDENPALVRTGLENIERWTRQRGYLPRCHAEWKELIEHHPWERLRESSSRNRTRASGCEARTRSEDSSPMPNGERFMTRQELEHIIRAAAGVTNQMFLSLPGGWESRLTPIGNPNTNGATGWCIEVHDKDLFFFSTACPALFQPPFRSPNLESVTLSGHGACARACLSATSHRSTRTGQLARRGAAKRCVAPKVASRLKGG